MVKKPFSKTLHAQYDKAGRQVVKKFLQKKGYEAKDNKDRYGVDLIVYNLEGKKIGYAEVEVRAAWKGANFPFEDLNIPFRKKKLFTNDLKTVFFSINNELTHMYWCDANTILNSKVENLNNKFVRNEPFFKVQLNDLKKEEL